MAVIKLDERQFHLADMPYLPQTVDDLFAAMMATKKANCPDWTDDSPSDFGNMLAWIFSTLAKWIVDNMERTKNNLYIGTTNDREAMRLLCELIGYQLGEGAAAAAEVTFTMATSHDAFTIPAGTKVATVESADQEAIVFETSEDESVNADAESAVVSCVQGETITEEIVGSSTAEVHQRFALARKPVVWQSETVEVLDGSWTAWSRVDSFVDSDSTDKHYRLETNEARDYFIVFGDGVNGAIPIRGTNNIRVTYRKGGGTVGNVAANTITEILSTVSYVESVTNAAKATGGIDRETLDHARIYGPASVRTNDRMVTLQDIQSLCTSYRSTKYGGVVHAIAYEVGHWMAQVRVVPQAGGAVSAGLKNELETYLRAKRMIGTIVEVVEAEYVYVDITAEVNVLPNYSSSEVAAKVRENLVAFLSPRYQDQKTGLYPHTFGRNLYKADLFRVIQSTAGVDFCQITEPVGDTIVAKYQIAEVGDISVTASGQRGVVSYYNAENRQQRSN